MEVGCRSESFTAASTPFQKELEPLGSWRS